MNKYFGLFILMWLSTAIQAQQPSGSLSFQNNADAVIDSVIGSLDFTEMTTDLLLEHSISWIAPSYFNGQSISDTNLINQNSFGLLYATVAGMGVNGPALPSPGSTYVPVMNGLSASTDTFPISTLFIEHDRIKPYAVDSNLLSWHTNVGGGQSLSIPPTQGETSSHQTRSLPDNIVIYPNPVSGQLYLSPTRLMPAM